MPEPAYTERPSSDGHLIPAALVARLRILHERLPPPAPPAALGETSQSEAWSLVADIWAPCHAYEQALRGLTAPNSPLDDRLRAVYGRLHIQALKIAILLAALDWADEGCQGRPVVALAHWYRAQQIAESWRASAHRLLYELGESEELRLEDRVLRLLRVHPDGLSARSLYRALRTTHRPMMEALSALEQDGHVERVPVPVSGRPGPRTDLFRLVTILPSETG
jgi:hypothetical protein